MLVAVGEVADTVQHALDLGLEGAQGRLQLVGHGGEEVAALPLGALGIGHVGDEPVDDAAHAPGHEHGRGEDGRDDGGQHAPERRRQLAGGGQVGHDGEVAAVLVGEPHVGRQGDGRFASRVRLGAETGRVVAHDEHGGCVVLDAEVVDGLGRIGVGRFGELRAERVEAFVHARCGHVLVAGGQRHGHERVDERARQRERGGHGQEHLESEAAPSPALVAMPPTPLQACTRSPERWPRGRRRASCGCS